MASEPGDASAQILKELRRLLEKSVAANARQLQNGAEILRHASRKKIKPAQLNQSRDVVRSAIEDYVRLSTEHASRLIDLGVEVSNHLLKSLASGAQPAAAPATRVVDVKLSGRPGDECQAVFIIECDRSQAVEASFKAGLFIDEAGESAIDVPVRFEPKKAVIQPGDSQRFVLAVAIPRDARPGKFKTLVVSEKMPDVGLRLLLEIESAEAVVKTTQSKAKARRAGGKGTKKKAKKKTVRKAASRPTGKKRGTTKKRTAAAGKKTASKRTTAKKASSGKKKKTR